jgi:glucoamylase
MNSIPMENPALLEWMRHQFALSAAAMKKAVSATHLVKERRPFGRIVRPVEGSVLASPVIAAYDPDPDYFFHWARDSAVVMDAFRVLIESGTFGPEAIAHFEAYVAFGLKLLDLDGAAYLRDLGDFRRKVEPFFLQYVREDEDLGAIVGERVQGEPRFNPDGTLDILKWSRPQHDGPATRALTLMRFVPLVETLAPHMMNALTKLLDADLGFTLRHWREPSYDIWEEELGAHYYTRLVQHAALADGAAWHESRRDFERSHEEAAAARDLSVALGHYWSASKGFVRSRLAGSDGGSEKDLDIAVVLGVVHARRERGAHSVLDPKILATLAQLEDLFAALYEINRGCGADRAPAMGRYAGDKYYSGGAYYFSTLGAAEFYYRLAAAVAADTSGVASPENEFALLDLLRRAGDGLVGAFASRDGRSRLHRALLGRGDAFMATVAAFAPMTGELAEQFDRTTGEPTSAKDLAWSHAAFITAVASREAASGPGSAAIADSIR